MKQTAVDLLFEKITHEGSNPYLDMIYREAKEIEKMQAINDYESGYDIGSINFDMTGEEYYNITYEKK